MFKLLSIQEGTQAIHQGQIIAYPTEGIYGFGCDPTNPSAVTALLTLKQRDSKKGFILIAGELNQIASFLDWGKIDLDAFSVVKNSWPGFVTWVLPASDKVLPTLLGPNQTIAIRVTNHPVVKNLCEGVGGPIVSTSINLAGHPALNAPEAIQGAFSGQIKGVVEGALGGEEKPSWVIDFQSKKILRMGPEPNPLTGV